MSDGPRPPAQVARPVLPASFLERVRAAAEAEQRLEQQRAQEQAGPPAEPGPEPPAARPGEPRRPPRFVRSRDWMARNGDKKDQGRGDPVGPRHQRGTAGHAAAPAGDVPAGDVPAGDVPAGDAPARDAPARDVPSGDAPARDAPAHAGAQVVRGAGGPGQDGTHVAPGVLEAGRSGMGPDGAVEVAPPPALPRRRMGVSHPPRPTAPARPDEVGSPLGRTAVADAPTEPIPVIRVPRAGEARGPGDAAGQVAAGEAAEQAAARQAAARQAEQAVARRAADEAAVQRAAKLLARKSSPGRHRRLMGLAAALLLVVAGTAVGFAFLGRSGHHTDRARATPADTVVVNRDHAAAWIAGQVSPGAMVSCDPATCVVIESHGFPASHVRVLATGKSAPLSSNLVVATPAVRRQFGARLTSAYAPVLLATFGSGGQQVDVRVVASHGAAAYQTALRADLQNRRTSGAGLSGSNRIQAPPTVRKQLAAGEVDSRLLITMALMASLHQVHLVGFGDGGPDLASAPFRSAQLSLTGSAQKQSMLAFLRAQRPPTSPPTSRPGGWAGTGSSWSWSSLRPAPSACSTNPKLL